MCYTALSPRRVNGDSAARRTLDYKFSVHNGVYLLIQILKAIKELSMTFDVVRVASFQKYHPRPDDLRWQDSFDRPHPTLKTVQRPRCTKLFQNKGERVTPLDGRLLGWCLIPQRIQPHDHGLWLGMVGKGAGPEPMLTVRAPPRSTQADPRSWRLEPPVGGQLGHPVVAVSQALVLLALLSGVSCRPGRMRAGVPEEARSLPGCTAPGAAAQ
ncbi:hypothetical protein L1887_10949 [Cichorium endivia]|nr:hypothetical protein L1887_10949 [Cichorium endivia]